VTTAFGVVSAKAAGARLWTPAQWHFFATTPAPPVRRPISTGVETLVTVGGDVVQTRVAAPVLREELAFAAMPRSACDEALAWLDAATDWGLYPFTYVDASRQVHTARLESTPVVQTESAPGLFSLSIALILPGEPTS
jgi:hypothetical protein